MKCMRNPTTGEVKRVQDPEASRLARYGWQYVPKSVFKAWIVSNAKDKAKLSGAEGRR